MRSVRWFVGVALGAVLCVFGVPGPASAADESLRIETSTTPRQGKLYKDLRLPVNTTLKVDVSAPASSPTITPLKRSRMKFPTDLTFSPNNRKTPVCPESKLNRQSPLANGVAATVDLCPRSVVGVGTAAIYLAKVHQPSTLLEDPQLVIFNAGRDRRGNAKIKIYAFAKSVNTGILMYGTLNKRGVLDVAIPVLASDSAVSTFTFNLPGTQGIQVEDGNAPGGFRTVRGLDPNYVRSKCSTGKWTTSGKFWLGERDPSTGIDTSPTFTADATPFTDNCNGLRGRARLNAKRANGPKRVRRGTVRVYRVRVRNNGTATARNVRIRVSGSGRGQARSGAIAPHTAKTIRVKVRVRGRKGSRARFVFRVNAKKASARVVARARILRR